MQSKPYARFVHRENRDGSFDSICVECFATVATGSTESDLAQPESRHTCNAADRERYAQIGRK